MKLRKLHIEDYKMFKDFDISFVDKNDEALPIVVLAGVNGSGKTSLLEFLYNKFDILYIRDKDFIIYSKWNEKQNKYLIRVTNKTGLMKQRDVVDLEIQEKIRNAEKNKTLIYIPSGQNELKNIEEYIVREYITKAEEIDSFKKSLQKLQDYIDEIFEGLDLNFKLFKVNFNDKKVFFIDGLYNEFGINNLSTGEKTLLSKVLYLYFKGYKNKVILIDEPELSLHPSWQNKVLKIYENFALKNNCQIIIATHSPHIIGSAKNEYIRFLEKDEEGHVRAINDIQAYGRDIEWVLEQMGVADTRLPKITKRFEEIQELINNQEFDKADDALDKLEYVIGENDKDILALRNDLAFERMDFEEDN